MIDNKVSVYLAVLNQGEIAVELSQCLDSILSTSPFPLFIDYSCEKPISYNRNQIVKRFLERPQYDYLIMIDSDIVPSPDYLKLIDFKKDIISGLCFAFTKSNVFPLILKKDKKKIEGSKYMPYVSVHPDKWKGLVEVDAVGTGAIVLSRKVLEAIPYPFRNEYSKTGEKMLGLDLNFCRRARAKGFQVFCHTDYVCSHHTRMDLKTIYYTVSSTFKGMQEMEDKIKKLTKENEALKRKKDNGKNHKKDRKQSVGGHTDCCTTGEKDKVCRTETEDVRETGDKIPDSRVAEECIKEKIDGGVINPIIGNDSYGDCHSDATSSTPFEIPTGDTEPNTAQ